MGKLKKIIVTVLAGSCFFGPLAACDNGNNNSGTGTGPSIVETDKNEEFKETIETGYNGVKGGNFTFDRSVSHSTQTYLFDGNKVRNEDTIYERGMQSYMYRYDGSDYHKVAINESEIPSYDANGITFRALSETEAGVSFADGSTGKAFYQGDKIVLESENQTLTFYNIGTTKVAIPEKYIDDAKVEQDQAYFANIVEKLKTPNYLVEYVVDDGVVAYHVDGNNTKVDTTIYTLEDGKNYVYTYNTQESVYYRAEGEVDRHFDFSDLTNSGYVESEGYFVIRISGRKYFAVVENEDRVQFYNSTEAFSVSNFGKESVVAPENYKENGQNPPPIIDEENIKVDGKYNMPLVIDVLTKWMNGDNQFGQSVYARKAQIDEELGQIMLVDFDENGLAFYVTSKSTTDGTLVDFRKIYFNDDEVNNAIKNATTKEDFETALNSVNVRKIMFADINSIDNESTQESINTRAQNVLALENVEANVLFAFETPTLAEDYTYGNGLIYKMMAFTNDGILRTYSIKALSKTRVENNETIYFHVSDRKLEEVSQENVSTYQTETPQNAQSYIYNLDGREF